MGLNLLRFGHWLSHEKQQPLFGIMSGERNESALHLAKREHMHFVYLSWKNKSDALDQLCEQYKVEPDEIVFFFDDVLDISAAKRCGMNFLIRRSSSPLFTSFVRENSYCDYISGQEGGHHALRECVEYLLGATGLYEEVVRQRIDFTDTYQDYFAQRNEIDTKEWPFKK